MVRRRWEISPLELLVPRDDLRYARRLGVSPLVRRMAVFWDAVVGRGRGRIPKAIREEAQALDRAERIMALLRRERVDPCQRPLPFLAGTPECLRWSWSATVEPGIEVPGVPLLLHYVALARNRTKQRAERKEARAEELKALQAPRRRWFALALRHVKAGRRDEALGLLRSLAMGADAPTVRRIIALVLAGHRTQATDELRALSRPPGAYFDAA